MKDNEQIKKAFAKQIEDNNAQISIINQKLKIFKINKLENHLITIWFMALISWIVCILAMPVVAKTGIISANLARILSIVVPASIGFVGERILTKKAKLKERLKSFSNAKSSADIIEEETRYEIAKQQLINSNVILTKAQEKLEEKERMIALLSDKYDISLKKDTDSADISQTKEDLCAKEKDMETLTIKSILTNKFASFRDGVQKNLPILATVSLGLFANILWNFPMVSLPEASTASSLIVTLLGGSAAGIYFKKRHDNHITAFKIINQELGENALDEALHDKSKEQYALELAKVINDIYPLKLEVEEEKGRVAPAPVQEESLPYQPSDEISYNVESFHEDITKEKNPTLQKKR